MDGQTKIYSLFWLGTGAILVLALCLILLAIFYQNNMNKIKIREGQELLRAKLEGEMTERKRIAADLHDGVSNDLNAIKTFLSILATTHDEAHRLKICLDLRKGIENAIESTRMISYTLMPPLIESRGLAAAIAENFERLRKSSGRNFIVSSVDNPEMPASIAYEIFRVIQEFSTNILKHSNATRFEVEIAETEKEVIIGIVDNGSIYSFNNLLADSSGAGLKNINSRLKLINASFTQISSELGNQFLILLPKQW